MASTTASRLQQLIRLLDAKSVSAFAGAIGVRSTVLANMLGGRMSKPSFDTLEKIKACYPQVSLEWLVMGTGTPLVAAPAHPAAANSPADLAQIAQEQPASRPTRPETDLQKALAESQRELAHWREMAATYRQLAEDRQTIIELLRKAGS